MYLSRATWSRRLPGWNPKSINRKHSTERVLRGRANCSRPSGFEPSEGDERFLGHFRRTVRAEFPRLSNLQNNRFVTITVGIGTNRSHFGPSPRKSHAKSVYRALVQLFSYVLAICLALLWASIETTRSRRPNMKGARKPEIGTDAPSTDAVRIAGCCANKIAPRTRWRGTRMMTRVHGEGGGGSWINFARRRTWTVRETTAPPQPPRKSIAGARWRDRLPCAAERVRASIAR